MRKLFFSLLALTAFPLWAELPLGKTIADLEVKNAALSREAFNENAPKDLGPRAESVIVSVVSVREELTKEWDRFLTHLRTSAIEKRSFLAEESETDNPQIEAYPATYTLLRAHVLSGELGPMAIALDLSATEIRLFEYQLISAHALARAHGLAAAPSAEVERLLGELEIRLNKTQALLPAFPDLRFGAPRNPQGALDEKAIKLFLANFMVKDGPALSDKDRKRILGALSTADATVRDLQAYYFNYYPQRSRTEALNHIATLIQQVPGLRECINLTRGLSDLAQNPITLSDFEGPSCDFPAFERALRLYVSYYRSQAGWTLLPALVDFFSNIGTNGPPHSLAAELDHFVLTHEPDESPLRHSWPQIQKTLLADPAQVNTWLSADTLTLNRDLKKTLLSAGVNIADGFDANYTENITQAEQLLANYKRFDLSTPIMTVDSETDCEPFLKGAKSPHRAAQVLRQAIIPEATQASSTGFLRSIPLYEVRVANLMSLQTPKVDRITLTGLLQTTALRQLTRSFAETQLLMGKEASLLIEEIEGTAKSNYMAVADTKFELSDHRASLAVVLGEAKRNITAGYRTYYRGQLLKAAEKLRELDATITRLNSRGGAATQAPPGLAKILNMPPEFTGESHKSNIGPINQSLIDLVGWVRDDYVRLHNIKERNYRLTVDQFKEQIDWYSGIENGRTVRPPRSTSFIGAEELTILQSHPVMQGLLTNHVQEILDGPRDLAIAMKELVAAHWPMLTSVDPRTGRTTEIWRTYTDKAFEKTLESHLSMIKGTTEVLFSQKDLDRTLTIGVSNRSLVDTVLRRFPSQKRAVCEEQIRIAGDKSFNAWVAGGFAALALGLSCTEVGAPAAVIPGAISLGISAHEAGKARIAAAQTHAYQVGSLSQRSSIERQNDSLYMRRLSDELLWRQIDTALSVGALATGGTIKFARLGKLLGSTERAVACSRVQTLRFFKNWPRAVAARASNPIVSSASRYASVRYAVRFAQLTQKTLRTVGETVLYPFHRLGLTAPMGADWRLFSELSPGLAAWQRVTVRGVHLVEDGAHLVVNLPLIPFGAKWGSGVAAKYLAGYGTYEIGNWGLHTWCAYRDAAMVVATARLSELMQNPEPDPAYAELIEAIYQGEITTTEAAQVLIYDARFTYQESINAVIEAAEPDPEVRRVRLRDLKRTIQSSVPIDANHRRAIDHAVREIDAAIGQI